MQNTKLALIWITGILKKHQVPFQISGGLAAKVYGGMRPLFDIDIDIPEDKFDCIKNEVVAFITYGPAQFKNDKWDLLLMTLDYQGQIIDLGGAYNTKIFNDQTKEWQKLSDDLSLAVFKDVLGLWLPVIPRDVLIAYKKVLSRKEDLLDIKVLKKKIFK